MSNVYFYDKDQDQFFSGNLAIMSWVADIVDGKPGNIIQLNPAFQDFIKRSRYGYDVFELNGGSVCQKENEQGEKLPVSLEHFILTLLGNDHPEQTKIADGFYTYGICKSLNSMHISDSKYWKDIANRDERKFTIIDGRYDVEIFWNYTDSGETLNIGARLVGIEGVRVPILEEIQEHEHLIVERFDLISTVKLGTANNKPIGIQGVFIPVQLRYEKVQEWRKRKIDAMVGATIARSFSHNIGSHALVHLQKELLDRVEKTNLIQKGINDNSINKSYKNEYAGNLSVYSKYLKYTAELLEYANSRAELIAMISNGTVPIFSSTALIDKKILPHYITEHLNDNERILIDVHGNNGEDNTNIDILGGNIGLQALCAIIENFVRNSYRHQKIRSNGDNVQLNIDIKTNADTVVIKLHDENALLFLPEDVKNNPTIVLDKVAELNRNFRQCIDFLTSLRENISIDYKLGTLEVLIWALLLNGESISTFLDKMTDNNLPISYDLQGDNNIKLVLNLPASKPINFIVSIDDYKKMSRIYYYESNHNKLPLRGRWILAKDQNYYSPYGLLINQLDLSSELIIQEAIIDQLFARRNIRKLDLIIIKNGHNRENIAYNANIHLHIFPDEKTDTYIQEITDLISDQTSKTAIWDWHGVLHDKKILKQYQQNIIHYESLLGLSSYRTLLNALLNDLTNKILHIGYLTECAIIKILIIDDRFKKDDVKRKYDQLLDSGITLINPFDEQLPSSKDMDNFDIVSFHISLCNDERLFSKADMMNGVMQTEIMKTLSTVPFFLFHTGRAIDSNQKDFYKYSIVSYNEIFKYTLSSFNKYQLTNYLINGGIRHET